jgi:hypothetical protein
MDSFLVEINKIRNILTIYVVNSLQQRVAPDCAVRKPTGINAHDLREWNESPQFHRPFRHSHLHSGSVSSNTCSLCHQFLHC